MFEIIFPLVVLMWIIWKIGSHFLEKKRRERLRELAVELGLEYSLEDPLFDVPSRVERFLGDWVRVIRGLKVQDRFSHLGTLNEGRIKKTQNFLRGRLGGRELIAFDYEYARMCDSVPRLRYRFSVVIVTVDGDLPALRIEPKNWAERLAGKHVEQQFTCENEDFESRNLIMGEDRELTCRLVTPELIEQIVAHPGGRLDIVGPDILYTKRRLWEADDLRTAIQLLGHYLDSLDPLIEAL